MTNRTSIRYRAGALAAVFACSSAVFAATPGFSDRTAEAGLNFTHGYAGDFDMGGEMHGGGTVGDFNADGWPDLFAPGGGMRADALFINNGDGSFTDRAAEWGLTDLYRGNGAAVGDYNGDGCDDLFVSSHGDMDGPPSGGQHRLYRNTCAGAFDNVAVAAGVNQTHARADGFGATFGDYDLDGDLDLFVAGWQINPGATFGRSRLFRNNGDETFTDVNQAANVGHTNLHPTGAFGVIFADMNHDRYPELLVAADGGNSYYYRNNRDGTFTVVDIFQPAEDKARHAMGATVADFDRNGELDWFITAAWPSMQGYEPPGNRLYVNQGDHLFTTLPESGGVDDGGFGWGTVAIDFDHDGWQDILMTNGWPLEDVSGHDWTNERSYLFRNNGNLSFTEVGDSYGIDHTGEGRSLVHFDYDKDGDMDFVIFGWNESMRLYRNDITGPDANWLQVVIDTSNHPAVAPRGQGSQVRVRTSDGEQMQLLTGGSNYLGRSELLAHFGLGANNRAELVQVTRNDGFRTLLSNVPANEVLSITVDPPLSASTFVQGQPATITVEGLLPTERAYFFSSFAGPGEGPCLAVFGGQCIGLATPAYRGRVTADASGRAVLNITVPVDQALETLSAQVLVRRGAGGADSIITNVVTGVILAPGPL